MKRWNYGYDKEGDKTKRYATNDEKWVSCNKIQKKSGRRSQRFHSLTKRPLAFGILKKAASSFRSEPKPVYCCAELNETFEIKTKPKAPTPSHSPNQSNPSTSLPRRPFQSEVKMASRVVKRIPTKSIKGSRRIGGHGHRRPRKSPIRGYSANPPATSSSSVLAAINRSLQSCRRCLIKILSKLARITTPKSSRRKRGFKALQEIPSCDEEAEVAVPLAPTSACKVLPIEEVNALPPLDSPTRKTIFLDLDETLVHSKSDPPPKKFDFIVQPLINSERMNFYVLKRPGVDRFLRTISERFEVVVFTAGMKEYASLVLDRLDPKGAMISHRLYRDSCRQMDGNFVKDLSRTGRDLQRVVIVDDNPNAYGLQPENAMPIIPFIDNLGDAELGKLIKFFEGCQGFDDMREAAKLYGLLEVGHHRKLVS